MASSLLAALSMLHDGKQEREASASSLNRRLDDVQRALVATVADDVGLQVPGASMTVSFSEQQRCLQQRLRAVEDRLSAIEGQMQQVLSGRILTVDGKAPASTLSNIERVVAHCVHGDEVVLRPGSYDLCQPLRVASLGVRLGVSSQTFVADRSAIVSSSSPNVPCLVIDAATSYLRSAQNNAAPLPTVISGISFEQRCAACPTSCVVVQLDSPAATKEADSMSEASSDVTVAPNEVKLVFQHCTFRSAASFSVAISGSTGSNQRSIAAPRFVVEFVECRFEAAERKSPCARLRWNQPGDCHQHTASVGQPRALIAFSGCHFATTGDTALQLEGWLVGGHLGTVLDSCSFVSSTRVALYAVLCVPFPADQNSVERQRNAAVSPSQTNGAAPLAVRSAPLLFLAASRGPQTLSVSGFQLSVVAIDWSRWSSILQSMDPDDAVALQGSLVDVRECDVDSDMTLSALQVEPIVPLVQSF